MATTGEWVDGAARTSAASRAARLAALVVAAGAAALSFRATAVVAESAGAVSAGWGWIVPLVIEAGVLTAAALAWVRSGEGVSAAREVTVMTALLALSVVVNVAHAEGGTVLGMVIAGVPPLVLLAAVEGLLREQRRAGAARRGRRDRQPAGWPQPSMAIRISPDEAPFRPVPTPPSTPTVVPAAPPAVPQPVGDPESAPVDEPEPSAEPEPEPVADPPVVPPRPDAPVRPARALSVVGEMANRPSAASSDRELEALIRRAVRDGETVTGAMIAQWLGVSQRTGSRRLKALTERRADLFELRRRAQ